MLAASTAPRLAMTSLTTGFISRLHAVGPGGGRGASVATNEHPARANNRTIRMRPRHAAIAEVAHGCRGLASGAPATRPLEWPLTAVDDRENPRRGLARIAQLVESRGHRSRRGIATALFGGATRRRSLMSTVDPFDTITAQLASAHGGISMRLNQYGYPHDTDGDCVTCLGFGVF